MKIVGLPMEVQSLLAAQPPLAAPRDALVWAHFAIIITILYYRIFSGISYAQAAGTELVFLGTELVFSGTELSQLKFLYTVFFKITDYNVS